jgi:hypothetical protein
MNENYGQTKNKRFLEETFTYKASKENSKKKNKSCFENRKNSMKMTEINKLVNLNRTNTSMATSKIKLK